MPLLTQRAGGTSIHATYKTMKLPSKIELLTPAFSPTMPFISPNLPRLRRGEAESVPHLLVSEAGHYVTRPSACRTFHCGGCLKHAFQSIASDLHAVLLPHLRADFRCAPSIRWVIEQAP
jgi:hypothetical protein